MIVSPGMRTASAAPAVRCNVLQLQGCFGNPKPLASSAPAAAAWMNKLPPRCHAKMNDPVTTRPSRAGGYRDRNSLDLRAHRIAVDRDLGQQCEASGRQPAVQ